ncbi:IclR family transcriptional regulator [Salipiger marinus]|uniref:Transcriptional regulator, IclR family n=1 Tax=Salipiger marinus TaxID=555512 RepID=A0A1G8SLI7_9RHOB|nr:IclR family transcriptional regulator [Salipiger marinus]SDJ30108.1 transcriptional regulator, IclR family [Salipiger marinus]
MSTLTNAAEVLRLFGSGCHAITVTEVGARLGLPKASASRLMKAMRECGMLETIGDSRQHRPGAMMLDLAAAFRQSSSLMRDAAEAVAAVTRQYGHTGYISIRIGQEVTAVVDFEGTAALRVVSNIGQHLPAHLAATGRALLARLPETDLAALYAGHSDLDTILPRIAACRAQGYSLSIQETTPGVEGISVAVGDPGTGEAVALCLVYPHAVVTPQDRDAMIAALGARAADLAQRFGDPIFRAPDFSNRTTP